MMEAKLFETVDVSGNAIKLKKIGERLLPPNIQTESWCCMRDIKTRVDDVFIVEYPKSVPFNSWEGNFLHWKKFKHDNPGYPIHTIRYEDMKMRPVEEIKKIADFLDIVCSEKMCLDIAKATEFSKMKQQKESLENKHLSAYKSGKEIMYRKGETGDWKNYFSSAEAESFDGYYRQKLETVDHIYLSEVK
ncbi:hypothetical protein SNE40_010105 [Patella caerulea]|uniref:Sulfotransferase domain-containing protein n=1 Tax=Patella caerulea TaxID=87958 RepID=A0AAN8K026_PATCE